MIEPGDTLSVTVAGYETTLHVDRIEIDIGIGGETRATVYGVDGEQFPLPVNVVESSGCADD
jgi:hypothetical protein